MTKLSKIAKASSSESFKRLNPQLFGGPALGSLQPDKPKLQQNQGSPLERHKQAQGRTTKSRGNRVRKSNGIPVLTISIIALVRRHFDRDNLGPATKGLRDYVAERMNLDDSEEWIDWQYGSVLTRGETGIVVRIEKV
jgi:hypothetical protein